MRLDPYAQQRLLAGAMTGLPAGIAMAVILVIGYLADGRSPDAPFRLIAASLIGEAALLPSAGLRETLTGLLLHLLASCAFGALFALISQSRSRARLLFQAILFAMATWASLQFIVFPAGVNLPLALRMPPWLFAAAHLGFAVTLLALPAAEQRVARQEERETLEEARRAA